MDKRDGTASGDDAGRPQVQDAETKALYTRGQLEEMSVIQMAAGIDIEMGPIPERAADPLCAKAVERRAYSRRLARAAFQLIPNFALHTKENVGAMEKALRMAKRLCDNINEFGACTDPEIYDAADTAINAALANATAPVEATEEQGFGEAEGTHHG